MAKWRIWESVFYIALGMALLLFRADKVVSGIVLLIGGLIGLVLKLYLK
ncbi:MAG: hypothetical protein FD169_1944 [Bacillota bacterium]|nr:MAG: hypothetical protein FD169_1944 [Bacillota bacterium]MBS3950180.1 hypothetical protein [Peptococcaceae bacterium]